MLTWFILLVYSYTISTYLLIDGANRFQYLSNILSMQVEYVANVLNQTSCNMTSVADGIVSLQDVSTEFGYINNCGNYSTPNYTYLYTTSTTFFAGYELLIVGPSCDSGGNNGINLLNGIIYIEIIINCLVGVSFVLFCVQNYAKISNIVKHRLNVTKYAIIVLCCLTSLATVIVVVFIYGMNYGNFSGEERNFLYVVLVRIVGIHCMGMVINDYNNKNTKGVV